MQEQSEATPGFSFFFFIVVMTGSHYNQGHQEMTSLSEQR